MLSDRRLAQYVTKMSGKPTPLGVGWIAQKNNNWFRHEPYTTDNGHNGVFGSESLIELT